MTIPAPVRDGYAHKAPSHAQRSSVGLSLGATLVLFAALPLANMIAIVVEPVETPPPFEAYVPAPPAPPTPPTETPAEITVRVQTPQLKIPPEEIPISPTKPTFMPGPFPGGPVTGGPFSWAVPEDVGAIGEFDPSQLDRQPSPLQRIAPRYPYEAKQAGITGWVRVLFVVDEQGIVRNPRVDASSHREFEGAALDAIRLWRFDAGEKDGASVRTRMVQLFRFNLND